MNNTVIFANNFVNSKSCWACIGWTSYKQQQQQQQQKQQQHPS